MTNNNFSRARALIYGKVQNVGLRASAVKKAEDLDVKGWVRNRTDGRVETLIVGEPENVEKMLDWFNQGPKAANVEKVDVITQEEISYNPFEDKFKINPTI